RSTSVGAQPLSMREIKAQYAPSTSVRRGIERNVFSSYCASHTPHAKSAAFVLAGICESVSLSQLKQYPFSQNHASDRTLDICA
ncbi:MAG: hypothetical protein WBA18_03735, partial [Terracidiphilus sp.]